MPSGPTLTITPTPQVKDQLGRLAESARRTESSLAAQAVANYVTREAEIIDGVERGMLI